MALQQSYRCRTMLLVAWLLTGCSLLARADAALLLEEPYGHFGAFTATGHAAVYLTRVCADSPTVLRRCEEGEAGVVIGRYNKIAGRDWLAIPLIPYLYAVEEADEIPLFANPKIVAFLRNQYRKNNLEAVAPDDPTREVPDGNWTQLVGAAYDRTIYGFEIETTPEQDDNFIREYNSRSNQSHFNLLAHNCADFAAGVMNFYYPHTLHRNLIADIGITTPKQISKLLVKFAAHHPDLQFSSFEVPQVPGTMPRSTPVHGVVESVLKAKKYLLPVAVLHPIVTGCLAAAYVGDGRFDPKRHAMILESGRDLEPPLPTMARRDYLNELKSLPARDAKKWVVLQAAADPEFDPDGRPVLQMRVGDNFVALGISRDNILNTSPALARELLTARLQMELRRRGDARVSEVDVVSDWKLLHQLMPSDKALN
ncbi:MAG TPA: hypothetical protein VEH30_10135 [Terriglobales bacterium]|nr:hypothetical protein [Terriglobales bacterium]